MRTSRSQARIQLVDDDAVVSNLLRDGLRAAGYQVTIHHDAESALAAYQSHAPDLAIVDIGLPDTPGTELAAAMLRHRYRPILILSSHSEGKRVRDAIDSGVVGYLVKPLSVQQLVPSIETALARSVDIGDQVAERLGNPSAQGVTLEKVLDQFSFAIAIVGDRGRVLYGNSASRILLDQHPLVSQQSGCLCASWHQRQLSDLLDRVMSGRTTADALTLKNGNCQLTLFVSTLENNSAAIVLIVDPRRTTVAPERVLRALYGLTAKESQLAEGLLNGSTLEDYCARRHVTLNTVRSQLKAIYRKTDTSRQAELIRLLSRLFDNVNAKVLG